MPTTNSYSATPIVVVEGAPLPPLVAATLTECWVDSATNVPDMFELRFGDENGSVLTSGKFTIGAQVEIKVQTSTDTVVSLLTGYVTTLESDSTAGFGISTVVRGLDKSHRMYHGRRVEAYQKQTLRDIASTVATRNALAVGTIESRATAITYDHVAQDGVSDWEFLQRLADEAGGILKVVDGKINVTMPVEASGAPSSGEAKNDPLILEHGENLLSMRATLSASGQVPRVEVRGWDPATKAAVVGTATIATGSAQVPSPNTPPAIASTVGAPPHVVSAPALGTQARCASVARALADHIGGGHAEIDGVAFGNPHLRAGVPVLVTKLASAFNGKYVLTAVRHVFAPNAGYRTTFTASNASERSLYGSIAGGSPTPRGLGSVIPAIVTSVQDPDQLGRVRVKFPTVADTFESWWARCVQPGAGAARGAALLPEVGDEVLVAFSEGTEGIPYVLGGLFNGRDKPDKPWSQHVHSDGKVKRRAFVSRTGMLVEFLEAPDAEQVTISTNGGAQRISLVQKSKAAIEIISEGPVKLTAKSDVEMSAPQGNMTLKAQKIVLDGTSAVEVKAPNVKVEGTTNAEVKGPNVKVAASVNAELSGGAATVVKGAIVKIN